MKSISRKLVFTLLLAILLIPNAFAGQIDAFNGGDHYYNEKFVGFAAKDTCIFAKPDEFSNRLAVRKGLPLYVVGRDPSNQFYIVENRSGREAYMLRTEVCTTLPANCNPFKHYDPKWEASERDPLLMLPRYACISESPDAGARTMYLKRDTPCRVIGKAGSYYIIQNPANSAVAYLNPANLARGTAIAV